MTNILHSNVLQQGNIRMEWKKIDDLETTVAKVYRIGTWHSLPEDRLASSCVHAEASEAEKKALLQSRFEELAEDLQKSPILMPVSSQECLMVTPLDLAA